MRVLTALLSLSSDAKVRAKLAELSELLAKRNDVEARMMAMAADFERACKATAKELNCVVSDRLVELAAAIPSVKLPADVQEAAGQTPRGAEGAGSRDAAQAV